MADNIPALGLAAWNLVIWGRERDTEQFPLMLLMGEKASPLMDSCRILLLIITKLKETGVYLQT